MEVITDLICWSESACEGRHEGIDVELREGVRVLPSAESALILPKKRVQINTRRTLNLPAQCLRHALG